VFADLSKAYKNKNQLTSAMRFVTAEEIHAALHYPELIQSLRSAFAAGTIVTPTRHHHSFNNPNAKVESTLLLMPSWIEGDDLGVKMVIVSPENGEINLPSIQGQYLLHNATTGVLKMILDAKALTTIRTAATSALASSYLSNPQSQSLLMIGTGALAPELIKAHTAVRPIQQVFVWGRSFAKATALCDQLKNQSFSISPIVNIGDKIHDVDIVSCATLSASPLVLGSELQSGQHIDLVGAYRTDMRESDDAAISKALLFIDHDGALREAGDMCIPLKNGIIKSTAIQADLFQLCSGAKKGRTKKDSITLFKSVGHALEDLVAAKLVAKHCS
jgi:ornithine cyclodeaminase